MVLVIIKVIACMYFFFLVYPHKFIMIVMSPRKFIIRQMDMRSYRFTLIRNRNGVGEI